MAPAFTIWNHTAPLFTIWNHMVPYGKHGTGWVLEKVEKDAHLRLILFPKDQIISFIQLHYKAFQLATLGGIL
jgi:hypothetical protein